MQVSVQVEVRCPKKPLSCLYVRQQSKVSGPFDFARQLPLTARAIASLAPRLDLAALVYVAVKGVKVLVIEAAPFRAIGCPAAPTAPAPTPVTAAAASATATSSAAAAAAASLRSRSRLWSIFLSLGAFAHVSNSPFIFCMCSRRAMRRGYPHGHNSRCEPRQWLLLHLLPVPASSAAQNQRA